MICQLSIASCDAFARHKILLIALVLVSLAIFSESALAMRCGTHVISVGRNPGLSMEEVMSKCGAPYAQSGYNWVYMKRNTVYKLRFSNVNGGLTSIKREIVR